MLVQDTSTRVAFKDVLLVVGTRRDLFEPFLGDADLALGGASVDLFQAVGSRVDVAAITEGFQQGVA